jgi:peptidoglycan LD-endopeptidase CwlK
MKKIKYNTVFAVVFLVFPLCGLYSDINFGTYENPIIDSEMTFKQAIQEFSSDCPQYIIDRQRLINVKYFSFDGKIHQGQLVIDVDLTDDVEFAFEEALKEGFPIYSVIPMSHADFRRKGRWDDNASMEANNTSCFNYRKITGGQNLSLHALGRAIDINPMQNPYIKKNVILPSNSIYDPTVNGTLTNDNVIVKTLVSRGWEWGGNWTGLKDYQHLEKNIKGDFYEL